MRSEGQASATAPGSDTSQAIRDFWLGLTTRSTAAWIGSFVVCAVEIALCCYFFQPPRLVRIDPEWLMEAPSDEYVRLSMTLLRLRASKLTEPHVAYLGASQASRALDSDDRDVLSRALTEAAGMPARFDLLSTNSQHFEDALTITDQYPRSFFGAVVLIVNDYKDDTPRGHGLKGLHGWERIAVEDAPTMMPLWREQGYEPSTTGVFFLDHLRFFAARRVAAVRVVKAKALPRVNGRLEFDQAAFLADRLELERRSKHPSSSYAEGRAPILTKDRHIIVKLLSKMKRRGVRVVFVENPEAPSRNELYAERVDRFHEEFSAFAAAHHAEYWDFNADLDLQQEDFQDLIHLGSHSARARFQRRLIERLGALLKQQAADDADDEDDP